MSGCAGQDSPAVAAENSAKQVSFEFESPVQLAAADGPVSVEQPGFAAPCWADIDQDGDKDLLVGQFSGGKIRVFKNQGDSAGAQQLAAGEWLEAGGKVAEVPGVW